MTTSISGWTVRFHDDFDAEFDRFSDEAQDALLAAARAVKLSGPKLGRPTVDTLNGSRHANMKELRYKVDRNKEIWRAAFAFDPNQNAIILCAAGKHGINEKVFYKALITKADRRFDQHLAEVAEGRAKADAAQKESGGIKNIAKGSIRSAKQRKGK